MFTAALFTIAGTWKQPKCPSADEWIKKMWHIYTMEYYSAIKRNEIELFVVRWMDLESVIRSEVRQKEKNKYRMLTHIYGIYLIFYWMLNIVEIMLLIVWILLFHCENCWTLFWEVVICGIV